jgi:hypothetical protein
LFDYFETPLAHAFARDDALANHPLIVKLTGAAGANPGDIPYYQSSKFVLSDQPPDRKGARAHGADDAAHQRRQGSSNSDGDFLHCMRLFMERLRHADAR